MEDTYLTRKAMPQSEFFIEIESFNDHKLKSKHSRVCAKFVPRFRTTVPFWYDPRNFHEAPVLP